MKPTRCAREGCEQTLTAQQLLRGTRYCGKRCAAIAQPRRAPVPGSISETARQLGIARHTLKHAIRTGRYVDGVYTPRRPGRKAR